jgi:hypothetical protein
VCPAILAILPLFCKYDNDYETAILRLKFCFDNSIDLEIEGLLSENPVIYLTWGEIERTKEILWKKLNN